MGRVVAVERGVSVILSLAGVCWFAAAMAYAFWWDRRHAVRYLPEPLYVELTADTEAFRRAIQRAADATFELAMSMRAFNVEAKSAADEVREFNRRWVREFGIRDRFDVRWADDGPKTPEPGPFESPAPGRQISRDRGNGPAGPVEPGRLSGPENR